MNFKMKFKMNFKMEVTFQDIHLLEEKRSKYFLAKSIYNYIIHSLVIFEIFINLQRSLQTFFCSFIHAS